MRCNALRAGAVQSATIQHTIPCWLFLSLQQGAAAQLLSTAISSAHKTIYFVGVGNGLKPCLFPSSIFNIEKR